MDESHNNNNNNNNNSNNLFNIVTKLLSKIDQRDNRIVEKDNYISNLNNRIIEKDNYITNLNNRIVEKDNDFSNLNNRIVEKDNYISNLNNRIIEKDNYITNLNNKIVEKDNYISNLNSYISNLKDSLHKKDSELLSFQIQQLKLISRLSSTEISLGNSQSISYTEYAENKFKQNYNIKLNTKFWFENKLLELNQKELDEFCKGCNKNISSPGREFHRFLKSNLGDLVNKKGDNILCDKSTARVIGNLKPDWIVIRNGAPVDEIWIGVYGDTKTETKFRTNKTMGQMWCYCDRALQTCDGLIDFVYGFTISPSCIQFYKVIYGKRNSYEITSIYTIPDGIIRLATLIHCSINNKINLPETMKTRLGDRYLELQFEANGASSRVFSTKDSIFKIYKAKKDKANEKEKLTTLNNNKIQNIPNIISSGEDWLEIQPRGISIHSLIPYSRFKDLLKTIKNAHSLGIIHRDIRHSNLVLKDDSDSTIILIDWAYAVKVGEPSKYSGTLYTASNRVLEHLSKKKLDPIKMEFSDDLESFVKTIVLIKEPGIDSILKQLDRENFVGIMHAWKNAPISSFTKKLLSYAQKGDYDKLLKELE